MRELPELFDRGIKARSLAYIFAATATVAVLTVLLPHDPEVNELELLPRGPRARRLGAVRLRSERATEPRSMRLAAGTALLTLANFWVESTALYPILYSWIALYAFYFFPLRLALAHVAWIGVAYAVLLGPGPPPSPRGALAASKRF